MKHSSQPLTLKAGAIDVVFDDGKLRSLCFGGVEVWRSIMFLYRDSFWATPRYEITSLSVEKNSNSFSLDYSVRCPERPEISWRVKVNGDENSRIHFDVVADLTQDLMSSRLGICVLHPLSAAGSALVVEHTDGRISRTQFPTLISPWQPFTQVRSLKHEFSKDAWASCLLEGDVFEMEDQRNFSDASFKTYSRSNFMPRPYRLYAGEKVHQSVTLKLDDMASFMPEINPTLLLRIHADNRYKLPQIGLLYSEEIEQISPQPNFWHLQFDFRGMQQVSSDAIKSAVTLQIQPTQTVRLDILLDDDIQALLVLEKVSIELNLRKISIAHLAIFPTTLRSTKAAKTHFPNVAIGGGTPYFFAQLNRLTVPSSLDFVSFTTSPIVHVADELSIMQSISTLPVMVKTLRSKQVFQPFHVGPIGIGMPLDPFAARVQPPLGQSLALAMRDSRDAGPIGTAWIFAYLCAMAQGGASAMTILHPAAFIALGMLLGLGGADLKAVSNSHPDRAALLAMRQGDVLRIWVCNLTNGMQKITIRLDNAEQLIEDLLPYELRIIDLG
jgi:D-apionolactonase